MFGVTTSGLQRLRKGTGLPWSPRIADFGECSWRMTRMWRPGGRLRRIRESPLIEAYRKFTVAWLYGWFSVYSVYR